MLTLITYLSSSLIIQMVANFYIICWLNLCTVPVDAILWPPSRGQCVRQETDL